MSEVTEVRHTDGGGGVATGMVLGVVLILLVLAVAAFMFFGNAFRPTTGAAPAQPNNPTNIQVNPPAAPPAKVDVNINPPAQQQAPAPAQQAPGKP